MEKSIFSLSIILLFSCTEHAMVSDNSPFVIEGHIENEGYPIVMITKSIPITTEEKSINNLEDYLIRWAKVSIINREDTVVLTGKYDKGYFPPYIYTTGRIKGKIGETYRLEIEYNGKSAYATTTITPPPHVDGYKIERCIDNDTLYQIKAMMTAHKNELNLYQFFSKVGTSNKQFLASFPGSYNDNIFIGNYEVPIYRGHQSLQNTYTPYFSINDTVAVKCCHLDEYEYNFWKTYATSQYLSGAAMFSASNNIPTNIIGGTGYWFGYGSTISYLIIKNHVE